MSETAPPETLDGRYAITSKLAEGGTAVVYAARGPAGDVVLKVLRRALADDASWARRFERETRALAKVTHPNLVPVIDRGVTREGLPYLVMPRLVGRTLRALLAERGALALAEAWSLLRPALDALAAAHAAGVVHRDVKPENVFVERAGGRDVPRLLDFGLARELADPERLTATGAPLGTPAYMAPEQWWNHGVGPASDQYAAGVVLFEMLAGRGPFRAEGFAALMQAHVSTPAPTLASQGAAAPEAVERFVARLLAKEPSARFASTVEAIAEGDRAFGLPAATPADPQGSSPWRHAWAWSGLAAALVAGYAGVRDPRAWIALAGFGAWPVAASFAALALVIPRRPRLAALAMVPGLLGTLATGTGWLATMMGVARAAPPERLLLYQEGVYEANVARAVAYLLSAGLLASALAGAPARQGPRAFARASLAAAALAGAPCAACALTGHGAVAVVLGAFAALTAASAAPRGPRPDEADALVLRALGVSLCWLSALTLLDARTASAWTGDVTRAARAAAVVDAAAERSAAGAAYACALALTVALGLWRVRRAPGGGRWRPSRAGTFVAAAGLAWASLDAYFLSRVSRERGALWRELAPVFALDARLSPPVARGLARPPVAPSLQLTTGRVAIDGVPVELTRALDRAEGARVLAADLSHRLAEASAAGPSTLLVAIDARVRWSSAARALSVARAVGAQRVTFLFTRGAAPEIAAGAPPEAAYALPRDFGGLDVELSDDGADYDGSRTFGEVGAAMVRERPARLRVR